MPVTTSLNMFRIPTSLQPSFLFSCLFISPSLSLHLQGTWQNDDFFLFLAKFGFQKTNPSDPDRTQGVIYGNIEPLNNDTAGLTLVLVDSEYFMAYYGNRTFSPADQRCSKMFEKIDTIAFDYRCNRNGREDFLRKVPCTRGKICVDEDSVEHIINGYQFTYKIVDSQRPRFWYISIVSCHRHQNSYNISCHWMLNKKDIVVRYNVWLVNGHPSQKHINPFEHQFSFELHDVVEIYLAALVLYCILFPIWLSAYRKLLKHPITQLFIVCIGLECMGIMLNFIHVIKFAFDGQGLNVFNLAGNAIDTFSECLFMLLLLFIAKGWAITQVDLNGKWIVLSVWLLYTILNGILFVWNLTEIDIIFNTDEWQTWPGYLILIIRLGIMLWFLYELRRTFKSDQHPKRLLFFQHFGAGFLVWFIYLPILAIISSQISALWRFKTVLSITYAADFLSAAALVHLLWPSRSVLYLIKQEQPICTYELEVTGLLDDQDSLVEESETKLQEGVIANGYATHTLD